MPFMEGQYRHLGERLSSGRCVLANVNLNGRLAPHVGLQYDSTNDAGHVRGKCSGFPNVS